MQQLSKFKNTELGEIPEDWNINRLEEISTITRLAGYEYTEYWSPDPNGSIIALRGFNISGNKLDLRDVERISEELSLKLKRSKLYKDNIVFPCVGSIGNAVLIEENNKYHINQNIAKLTVNSTIFPLFLTHILLSDITKRQIIRFNASTSQPNVLVGNLRKFYVPIPPIKEQQKIASILSKVDGLIQKTEQIIEQTQRFKKGLMQKLLTKGIGHTKFKKTELGEIPDSWQLVNINHIIKDKDGIKTGPFGSSLKKEIFVLTGYKIYGQENVIPDDFTIGDYFISEEIFLKMKKFEIKPGDILISLVGTHGKVSVVPDNIQRGIINPRLLRIRLDQNKVVPIYMKILLESNYIEKQTKKLAHGLTMGILNTNTIRQFNFVIPSIEQRKIISIFFTINEKLKNMKDYKLKIELLKKGLMQQLLTGKIRVKV